MSDRRQLLMLTQPSSGSSWLCDCMAKALNGGPEGYYREFFNPALCPRDLEPIFSSYFASELVPTHENVLRFAGGKDGEAIRACLRLASRWGVAFTKVTMQPFLAKTFAEEFDVFVLLRREEETFPPSRGRVYSFYNQIYQAYNKAYVSDDPWSVSLSLDRRCRDAHQWMRRSLLEQAEELSLPVLHYETMMGQANSVRHVLQQEPFLSHLDVETAVSEILKTRSAQPRKAWKER